MAIFIESSCSTQTSQGCQDLLLSRNGSRSRNGWIQLTGFFPAVPIEGAFPRPSQVDQSWVSLSPEGAFLHLISRLTIKYGCGSGDGNLPR